MRVRHPYALSDDPPAPDSRVHIGGRRDTHPVDDDGVITVPDDIPRSAVESWAEGYGYDLAELVVDESLNQQSGGDNGDVLVKDGAEICGTEKSDGDICERPADECPYHD